MRTPLAIAFVLLAADPTAGQEKFSFKPMAQAGDVFEVYTQKLDVLKVEKPKVSPYLDGSKLEKTAATVTVVASEDGQVTRLDQRIDEHTLKDGQDSQAETSPSPYGYTLPPGASDPQPNKPIGPVIRYERFGDSFRPMLYEGELNPRVADRLALSGASPLKEAFLPSEPLAVGQSWPITDKQHLKRLFPEYIGDVEAEKVGEATITLEKVDSEEGRRTAFLTLRISVEVQDPSAAHGEQVMAARLRCEATVVYDLANNFITHICSRQAVDTPGAVNDEKAVFRMETTTVERFSKR